MSPSLEGILKVFSLVLRERKYKIIFALTSIVFSVSYMIFTGIFIFIERPIPDEFTVPMFRVSRIHTVYGDFPWFIAYLDRHTIFSMTMEALAFAVSISFLVGLNSALLAYRLSSQRHISCRSVTNSVGFFGIVPAFLSIFACCGGGILVLLFGAGILATLFPLGPLFSILSIAILGTGIFLSAKELGRTLFPKSLS